jgi:hypothetical protein
MMSCEPGFSARPLALVAFGFSLARVLDGVTVNSLHDAVSELATADRFAAITGRYFERVQESRAHQAAYDLGMQDRLWDVS